MSSTLVEPRLARRRRQVREQGARLRLRRLIRLLVVLATLGLVGWLLQSPWTAVREVEVYGVDRSAVLEMLDEAGVTPGRPLVVVRTDRVRALLEADPWVARATVRLVLPATVEVEVVERVPVASVWRSEGWALAAADGTVLEASAEPTGGRVAVGAGRLAVGERAEAPHLVAALEFMAALPGELRSQAEVRREGAELWAVVSGHLVRLGPPVEMAAKAAALAAVLDRGLDEGAVVDVISPTRPALRNPPPEVEDDG